MKLAILVTFFSACTAFTNPSVLQRRANKRLGSANWSGALVHEAGAEYKSVTAELTISNPTYADKAATYQSSVWVGFGGFLGDIDGYRSKEDGILQTGFYYLQNDPDYGTGVFAFYEWYPDVPKFFEDDDKSLDLKLTIGDKIRITATQTSPTSGSVLFENLTKNTKASTNLTAPAKGTVDTSIAEWAIETFSPNISEKDVDFGTMVWGNMAAIKADSSKADLANAYFMEINTGSNTTVKIQSPAGMTCDWVGS